MAARRLSSDKRRQQIAKAAATLFARRGFAGVTTHEIAKRAGVNEAIVFRHFSTKRALYTEIINQKIKLAPYLFSAERLADGDDAAVLSSLAKFIVHETKDDPSFLRLMLYSALEDNELADLFFTERTNLLVEFLLKFVQRRVRQGLFRKLDPKVAVRAFLGMILHFILTEELYDLPKNFRIPPKTAVNQFVNIFLNGMRQKEGSK